MPSQKYVTLHVENIDLDLLRTQRLNLLNIEDRSLLEDIDTIEGVLNILDAMIDNYDQENNTESLCRNAPSGASGTLTGRTDNPEISVTAEELELMDLNPESDPWGKNPNDSGAKLDAGKLRPALVLGNFPYALTAVAEVGTYGANKYSANGWKHVPNGVNRYMDAALRHWLKHMSGDRINEEDGGVSHLAQTIWNLLAVYELGGNK